MTTEERYRYMTEEPVGKIIPVLAVPTIISMLVTSVYNMADTYFVGKISTEAAAAVGVIFSLMAIIQALGFTIGMGSGNVISRLLGKKDFEKAERVAAVAFVTAIIVGVLLAVFGLGNISWLVSVLGAIEAVKPYAESYASYILIAAPVMMGSYVLNNLLRSQGSAVLSMVGIATGAVLNVILDPIFIFAFDMGIAGAALATILSQCISFCILFSLVNFRKNGIHIKLSKFKPSPSIYGNILHSGSPSLCRQGLASVAGVVTNNCAGAFGPAAIAALSIVNRITFVVFSVVIGFGQAFQPVCGFNYGAKKYDRVIKAYKVTLRISLSVLVVMAVLLFAFSGNVVEFMKKEDADIVAIGSKALRFQCMTMPLQAFIIVSQFLTQSIGYGGRASLIAMSRQGIFLIPAFLVLTPMLGILGLQLAQPISDVLTFILSFVIKIFVIKRLNELKEGF